MGKDSVYPNPTRGLFNVEINSVELGDLQIEILDVQGKIIQNNAYGSLQGNENKTIDISACSNGMYFVKVTINQRVALFRISKN